MVLMVNCVRVPKENLRCNLCHIVYIFFPLYFELTLSNELHRYVDGHFSIKMTDLRSTGFIFIIIVLFS